MYLPREDSFFLSETLNQFFKHRDVKSKKFLDIGSGTGIQAETLEKFTGRMNIVCADIDKESLLLLKSKGFNAVESDLFSNIQGEFDFIIFNPPYLPAHPLDKQKDTTGGKLGDETILRFLKEAEKHLSKNGKIFLLISSLTPEKRIYSYLKSKYKFRVIATKNLFFEKLKIFLISRK